MREPDAFRTSYVEPEPDTLSVFKIRIDKFDKAYSWAHPEPSLGYAAIALGCWGRVLTEHLIHSKLSLFVSSC